MWKYSRKLARKVTKGKKGMSSLEFVIGILIFLLIFAALVDIVMIGVKFSATTQTIQHVTRIAGTQGGIMSSVPQNYPGGGDAYHTAYQVREAVEESMNNAGIDSTDYTLKVGNRTLTTSGTGKIDYQEPVKVHMEVNYEWKLLSNFLPGKMEFTLPATRTTVSEFKHNYDSW